MQFLNTQQLRVPSFRRIARDLRQSFGVSRKPDLCEALQLRWSKPPTKRMQKPRRLYPPALLRRRRRRIDTSLRFSPVPPSLFQLEASTLSLTPPPTGKYMPLSQYFVAFNSSFLFSPFFCCILFTHPGTYAFAFFFFPLLPSPSLSN